MTFCVKKSNYPLTLHFKVLCFPLTKYTPIFAL